MYSAQMPTPSMPKAMNMVFSRPIMSEIQPKNGRVRPLRMRSMVAAKVTAVIVSPISVTGTLSTFQSTAIGLRLAVTISPPAPTITNMKYISQKIGWRITSVGA